jgi:hypothetical protein
MKRAALGVFLMWMMPAVAFTGTVTALVDRTQVVIGESIHLKVTLSGAKGSVEMPALTDFKVIPRGTSSSFQFINGDTRREVIHNYTLIPLKTGALTIPAIPVKTGDGLLATQAIAILVSDRPAAAAGVRNVFVSAEISNPEPYAGEHIIYTFKLHNAVRIANARFEQPDFDGFSAKQIEGTQSRQTVLNGRQFEVHTISFVLVPLRAGEKIIGPATLNLDILRRRARRPRSTFDSFFDDSFFRRLDTEPAVFQSEPLKIRVKALPPPESHLAYSGLVGAFDLRADLENAELTVGDSATLSLTVKGSGNIMDAQTPAVAVPESFKVYEDAPEEEIQMDRSGYSGQKVFRLALVPVKEGRYTIPPVRLSYFNTTQQRYEILETPPLEISVSPSTTQETLAAYKAPALDAPSFKQKVEFSGRDILPLKEGVDALVNRSSLPFWLLLVLLASPGFLFTAALGVIRITRKKTDPASVMAERAQSALREARQSIGLEASGSAFAASLYRALRAAVFARAGREGESLTTLEAENLLTTQGLAEALVADTARLLERLEAAGYGGLDLTFENRKELLSETKALIDKLL